MVDDTVVRANVGDLWATELWYTIPMVRGINVAVPPSNIVGWIVAKRDAQKLRSEEIHGLIEGFMAGTIADYQLSAWLMAAWLQGLDDEETTALTDAMLHSGRVLELASVTKPKIDKHSTGGVGDKISLCLAPLVAACDVAVPMVAGRGLGHTGGTLDKLEAIEGYSVHLSAQRFERIVRTVGTSIIGQTRDIAPADGRIYALRDVTGTVESIPLIVASILSKKLAEGIDGLVLDVKSGSGAFMKTQPDAEALARSLVRVGRRAGKKVVALVTPMNVPTGMMIGNALETAEAIDVLRGEGPEDTRALTLVLAERMLLLAGVTRNPKSARSMLLTALQSGAALEVFRRMVHAQSGDVRFVDEPRRLPRTRSQLPVPSNRRGIVSTCDALALGHLAGQLGAGRTRAGDPIDHAVGIQLLAKPGTRVEKGDPLCLLHVRSKRGSEHLVETARGAFSISTTVPTLEPTVLKVVD